MMSTNDQPLYLSVVLPCANERDNLEPMIQELEAELRKLARPFEVIVVDDASTDGGMEVLRSLQQTRPWLRVLQHRVNCGQSASYCSGFRVATGELVVTMDADRQHDPADIPVLLRELAPPVAAVCGVRTARHDNWVRRGSSRIANGFASWMTGDQVVDAGCTFRILRRPALAELPAFNGLHRFIPTLLRYQGYQIVRVPIRHRNRLAGVSKYGIGNRLWRGILDCLAMRWYHRRCFQADRLAGGPAAVKGESKP
jgi:glycosyltransferase involved in cell wall biosynthesis